MMLSNLTDNDLVSLVKDRQDSGALTELTNRHSGIYVSIAQKYSGFSEKIQLAEIRDDKEYNMYKWIIKYEPDRNMKLGTYIGEMTRYLCLDLITETPDKVELTAIDKVESEDSTDNRIINEDSISGAKERAARVSDPRFWTIFELRHLVDKNFTWREIGKEIGLTHEAARGIYNRHIHKVKDFIS